MLTALLTSILLAQADGGAAKGIFTSPLYGECPVAASVMKMGDAVDAGFAQGWYLFPERAARIACLMETCEADRSRREKEMAQTPPPVSWVTYVGVAISSGIIVYGITKAAK